MQTAQQRSRTQHILHFSHLVVSVCVFVCAISTRRLDHKCIWFYSIQFGIFNVRTHFAHLVCSYRMQPSTCWRFPLWFRRLSALFPRFFHFLISISIFQFFALQWNKYNCCHEFHFDRKKPNKKKNSNSSTKFAWSDVISQLNGHAFRERKKERERDPHIQWTVPHWLFGLVSPVWARVIHKNWLFQLNPMLK